MVDEAAHDLASRRWLVLAGVWLVYCAFGSVSASFAPLIPEIRAELGVNNMTLGLILGSWPFVYIFTAIPAGIFLDRVGPAAGLFMAALVISGSAALRGMATGPETMLLAVMVFGIGGPLVSAGAPKLIAAMFEGASRGTAVGIYQTGPNVGAIASLSLTNSVLIPLLGSWRAVMFFHAGVAICAGLIWLFLASLARLPKPGVSGEGAKFRHVRQLLLHREMAIILSLAVGVFYINHGLNNWLPAILRATGMDASAAGFWAAIPMAVGMLSALTIPRLATGVVRSKILIALALTSALACLTISLGSGSTLAVALFGQGIVRGALNSVAVLTMLSLSIVPKDRVGIVSGLYFTAAEIGGVLGPMSLGTLRDLTGSFTVPLWSVSVVAIAVASLSAWLALLERRAKAV